MPLKDIFPRFLAAYLSLIGQHYYLVATFAKKHGKDV